MRVDRAGWAEVGKGVKGVFTRGRYTDHMASHPTWLNNDERKRARAPLSLVVQVADAHVGNLPSEMIDVTGLGCRLRLVSHVPVGAFLTISFEGFTPIGGWVAWRKGQEVGIDFSSELKDEMVKQIFARWSR